MNYDNPSDVLGALAAYVVVGIVYAVLYARRQKIEAWRRGRVARRITAVENGQRSRLIVRFRGTYGDYPRKWRGYIASLETAGLVLRPGLLARFGRPTITITEPVLSAHERPWSDNSERRLFYNPRNVGTPLQLVAVTSQTPRGTLEYVVTRHSIPVLLHYLQRRTPK